ncbi:MAG: hypothetical protein M1822_005484 [Bathelium mastoideum]|nr:MAG: hypothetical protein M1822_005484 [Bathelium mastoideum]
MNPLHILRSNTTRIRTFTTFAFVQQNGRSRSGAAGGATLSPSQPLASSPIDECYSYLRWARIPPPAIPSAITAKLKTGYELFRRLCLQTFSNNPVLRPVTEWFSTTIFTLITLDTVFLAPPSSEEHYTLSQASQQVQNQANRAELETQMPRRWRRGDVYAPHDLSGVEMQKWRPQRAAPKRDVFDQLGIDPRNEYKNFALLGEFMTETGRIKHSSVTGLRPRNQRRIAKAIRRAIGIGIMPSVHKHPEMLLKAKR